MTTQSLPYSLNHIAMIMDGNRRWAEAENLPTEKGHTQGAKNIKKIIESAIEKNIPYITFWGLSTDNILKRNKQEISHIFSLFKNLKDYQKIIKTHSIQFKTIGNLALLPKTTQEILTQLAYQTQKHTGITVTLAVGYGGKDEIIRAVHTIIAQKCTPEHINETTFASFLDTKNMPEVDLVIRTGGHARLSGFLPWQSTYAELYFTDTKWPDFSPDEFTKSINWFADQKRNTGA